MDEFCRGWRRKVGCVTLAVALMFMGGWLRSQICSDAVRFGSNGGRQFFCLRTFRNRLVWERVASEFDVMVRPGWSFVFGLSQTDDLFGKIGDFQLRKNWYEFDFGEKYFKPTRLRQTYGSVPYWSIVLPLTALSAFLLLSKPRQSTPQSQLATGECES